MLSFGQTWAHRSQKRARKFLARILNLAKPVLANLASIPLTVAGTACIDIGVFTANVVAGWIVTGISLVILEHLLADEQ